MAKRLIIDTSNILFRVAAVNNKKVFGTDEEKAGLAMHVSLQSVHKYYRRFRPDHLMFIFEGKNNWRKTYTQSAECKSGVQYKGNRIKDKSMEPFFELIGSFKEVMEKHSSAICISDDNCESDDVIGGIVEYFENDEIVVVSGDQDFLQLYKYPNFTLIDPATGKDRRETYLEKHKCAEFDPAWFMFEKCIRGDAGDNVPSAFPRVRSTKIKAAYEDSFTALDFMNTEWTDQNEKTFRVGDLFKENQLLMDLSAQPEWVRHGMFESIARECANPGSYSHFHFMRFLGKYQLNTITENMHNYVDMLSCTHKAPEAKTSANKIVLSNKSYDKNSDKSDDKNVVMEDRTQKSQSQESSNNDLLQF